MAQKPSTKFNQAFRRLLWTIQEQNLEGFVTEVEALHQLTKSEGAHMPELRPFHMAVGEVLGYAITTKPQG